jgi:hypothetical protein
LGVRATMLVAGTAAVAAASLTLNNGRRMAPAAATVNVAPAAPPSAALGAVADVLSDSRSFLLRRIAIAAILALAVITLVTSLPAVTTLAAEWWRGDSSSHARVLYGPPVELRAGTSASGSFEQASSAAMPPAAEIGGLVLAGAEEEQSWRVLAAMVQISEQRQAAVAAASRARAAAPAARNPASSLNGASGYAPGTIVRARITVYGCTGPGGGFCGNMSSGVPVFEGAAACSRDLPFGTKLRISGDPTGRVYECLDRGALRSTWVDVFFHDTREGIRWQSLLGGTVTDIEIVN